MQDVFLLPDTVRENILLGREMSAEAFDEVLVQAQFIEVVKTHGERLDRVGWSPYLLEYDSLHRGGGSGGGNLVDGNW